MAGKVWVSGQGSAVRSGQREAAEIKGMIIRRLGVQLDCLDIIDTQVTVSPVG